MTAQNTATCRCQMAVLRAYSSMAQSGAPLRHALDVAVRVYRFHHPEVEAEIAQLRVEMWVQHHTLH